MVKSTELPFGRFHVYLQSYNSADFMFTIWQIQNLPNGNLLDKFFLSQMQPEIERELKSAHCERPSPLAVYPW